MSKYKHSCHPARAGQCAECRRLREMTRREFMEWFARKYDKVFCPNDSSHLIPSYAHSKQCRA